MKLLCTSNDSWAVSEGFEVCEL